MWAIFALSASVVWGLYYAVIEESAKKISTLGFMAMSTTLWTILLLLIAVFARVPLKTDIATLVADQRLLFWFILAIVLGVVAQYLIISSVQMGNATVTSLVEITYPMFVALFSWAIFGRMNVSWPVLFGAILIFSGVGVLVYFRNA